MSLSGHRDLVFMQEAIKEAKKALEIGEVPVGAVAVVDDRIIAKAFNLRERLQDPTLHAEIILLRKASSYLKSWRLNNVTIYVTLEPCIMCASAMILARVKRVVYAAKDHTLGAIESHREVFEVFKNYSKTIFEQGPLSKEASELLKEFFKSIRA